MRTDVASSEKLSQLRSFTGAGPPDTLLRAALVRAGGDLNHAASVLLTEGALSRSEPLLVPAAAAAPRPVQRPAPSPRDARRMAWRVFYKRHYDNAMRECGPDKAAVDRFVAARWKALGAVERDALTRAVSGQARSSDQPHTSAQPQTSGQAVAVDVEVSGAKGDGTVHSKTDASGKAEKDLSLITPVAAPRTTGTKNVCRMEEAEEPAASPPAKRPRHSEAVVEEVQVASEPATRPDAVDWPKKLVCRLCSGSMLVSGRNLLRAGDTLTLSAPAQPRVARARARPSAVAYAPPKIVRFSRDGRELGRLAPDVGTALAPALQGGFVHTECRVVAAPKVAKMFAEVFLEITVYLTRSAFQGEELQKVVGCGASISRSANADEKAGSEKGVDLRRFNVVHLISSLKLCEPPEQPATGFPLPQEKLEGDPGAISEEGAEAYYKTVEAIHKEEATAFVPPKNFASTLREYQRAGVGWMVAREEYGCRSGSGDGAALDVMMDPLWKRRIFPDGTAFFMNATTGGLSLDAPVANAGGPYGGILADEMGLGKTVQCIACIVHDMEQLKLKKGRVVPKLEEQAVDVPRANGTHLVSEEMRDEDSDDVVIVEEGEADGDDRKNAQKDCESSEADAEAEMADTESSDDEDRVKEAPSLKPRRRSRRCASSTSRLSSQADDSDATEKEGDDDWDAGKQHDAESGKSDGSSDDEWFESPRKKAMPPKRKRVKAVPFTPVSSRTGSSKGVSALERMMSSVKSGDSSSGGTLIVCPMSLITQWMSELSLHIAPNFLRARTHYGQSRGSTHSISCQCTDVVVTSYGILASECPEDSTKSKDGAEIKSSEGGPLFQLKWRRVILDEAHMIKGRTTKWARASYKLRAERRWCVTGTVIHNHINDVYSLLHFLQMKPWSAWAFWTRAIEKNIESKQVSDQREAMCLVRDILSSLTLRRKKTTKDSQGKCIVVLPKKTVEIVTLTPSPEERDFYSALHQKSKVQFDKYLAQGRLLNNFSNVLELLLRLRQACDHPYLVFAAPSKDTIAMKDKDKMFKQFLDAGSSSQYVETLLKDAETGDLGKSRECPVCLDVMDDAVAPKECGHPACRGCLLESLQRSNKCPVCRVLIAKDSIATLPRSTRFSVDLKKKWRSSAKIDALLKDVKDVHVKRIEGSGQAVGKTVIFSQFTSMLDLVGTALEKENLAILRIDGQVSQANRALILKRFEEEDELEQNAANVLLVSLRAGGVGLNLVSAAHAILLDIHWNPQVDAQAQDRVHRHGQTRDVVVKRYIMKDSVEEKLLQVQARKKNIADGALETASEEDKKQAKISELKLLFSGV